MYTVPAPAATSARLQASASRCRRACCSAARGGRTPSPRSRGCSRGESIPPRRTIGQVWLIIRRLRANSPVQGGHHLSLAPALGTYTALDLALDDVERKRQVVAHVGSTTMYVALRGVDRPVAWCRAEAGLERTDRELVTPVHALLVARAGAGRGLHEAHLAACIADVRIGERAASARAASGSHRALASENARISPLARCTAASCALILPPRDEVEHEIGTRPAGAGCGPVGAAVAGDDHLEQLSRIVLRERVGHLRPDHRLLVVRGDDQRQRGSGAGAGAAGAPRTARRARARARSRPVSTRSGHTTPRRAPRARRHRRGPPSISIS